MVIDPNGMDEWDIDMKTGDVRRTEKEGKEIVRLNKNGETLSNMTFDEKSIALINDKKELAKDEKGNPLTNTLLRFDKSSDAEKVFTTIASFDGNIAKESEVEWDYLKGNKFIGEGYLQTSGEKDKIVSDGNYFNSKNGNVREWRHYHPSSNSEPYIVSESDFKQAKNLNVPSHLHFNGRSVRFDKWTRYKSPSQQVQNHYR